MIYKHDTYEFQCRVCQKVRHTMHRQFYDKRWCKKCVIRDIMQRNDKTVSHNRLVIL